MDFSSCWNCFWLTGGLLPSFAGTGGGITSFSSCKESLFRLWPFAIYDSCCTQQDQAAWF